jgi:hypothetical protein
MERIRCQYPDSGGVIECTREQFEIVYAPKGWVEVAPDTPLTDQSFNPEGGGETQPPVPSPLPDTPVATTAPAPVQAVSAPVPKPVTPTE